MDKDDPEPPKADRLDPPRKNQREARLAQALRDNLRRRKALARTLAKGSSGD